MPAMRHVDFRPEDYGNFAPLLVGDRLNELGPGNPDERRRPALEKMTVADAFHPRFIHDLNSARCCLAAIWLLHDFLPESHALSQEIHTVEGSFWHGIMHRREPDPENAKYWFRRVGRHETFDTLCPGARELAETIPHSQHADFLVRQRSWDADRFIDLCHASGGVESADRSLCREIQRLEWELLFDYCYRRAVGD